MTSSQERKNENRRRSYATMDSVKKERLLLARRTRYAAKQGAKKNKAITDQPCLQALAVDSVVTPDSTINRATHEIPILDASHTEDVSTIILPGTIDYSQASSNITHEHHHITSLTSAAKTATSMHSVLRSAEQASELIYKLRGKRRKIRTASKDRKKRAHVQCSMYPSMYQQQTLHASTSLPASNSSSQNSARSCASLDVPASSLLSPCLLPEANKCAYFFAFKFSSEPPGFCCSQGEVHLYLPEMPPDLATMYTSSAPESIEFRRFARSYNNNLAFTTFSATTDNDLLKNNKGHYVFKVQGKVHHKLPGLTPSDDKPKGLQLYFYDSSIQLEKRLQSSTHFQEALMSKLMSILSTNPYTLFLKQLHEMTSLDDCTICLTANPSLDQRVYNLPTTDDVSVILSQDTETEFNSECHIQIYDKLAIPYRICHNYGCYDPLQYPLLFPRGEPGWHVGIEKLPPSLAKRRYRPPLQINSPEQPAHSASTLVTIEEGVQRQKRKRNAVSCRQYYCYKLQIRDGDKTILLRTGRLFQQYIVDMYVKIETSRLQHQEKRQQDIRTEYMQGIIDSIASGHTSASEVGRKVILSPSFTGGPRDMRKRYLDAMALVQKFGKPDFFLTMTCNPAWPEITKHLQPGELAQNRPDLLSRVFKAKFESLKHEILKDHILGEVSAFVYSIEFQKRGLPHVHLLLIMKKKSKPLNPEAYDQFISAELPCPHTQPRLHAIVLKHMIHGPCGELNAGNPCMRNGKCKSKYPKDFVDYTTHGTDSYPHYKRRNTGIRAKVRGHMIDNRSVVPYNPYLLSKYDCHMNVEICSTIKLVKYIYKYIYKGHDKVAYSVKHNASSNEIKEYQQGRWVSPPEAAWRIFSFALFEMHPHVISLQVHLPNNYPISFPAHANLNSILQNDFHSQTMLTQFFSMNKHNNTAKKLDCLYRDFPCSFVWSSGKRIWTERKNGTVIGRVVAVSPVEGDRYYLRLLLSHVRAPTSYDDLLTVDTQLYSTFREAALHRNLLSSDYDLDKCLSEACLYQMPYEFRRLFASVLAYCSPNNPLKLWEKYEASLSEDFIVQHNSLLLSATDIRAKVVQQLSALLESMGKRLCDYHLFPLASLVNNEENIAKEIASEKNIHVDLDDLASIEKLNRQQRNAYNTIMEAVSEELPYAFFVDGPGGTGKTFLYRSLLATLRSKGYIALATASSGVAASILPGGRTAHSRFKLPLNNDVSATSTISKQSAIAKLILEAKLIIWDEAPMANRHAIENFDQMLRDLTSQKDYPFGGKVIVFGGDFRQVLPVVKKGSRQSQVNSSLVSSPLWKGLTKLYLTENMRARTDAEFSDFLLCIGNGTVPEDEQGNIVLPINILIPYIDKEKSLQYLIDCVYPDIKAFASTPSDVMNRVLLAPTNECVDDINSIVLRNMPGETHTYTSTDIAIDPQHQTDYEDFLHSLNPSNLPQHKLHLKVNCPIMLLRNLLAIEGFCNGTRLICKELNQTTIKAEIAAGPFTGKPIILHKIPLQSSDDYTGGIPFKRYQFPIRLCFAMTINKSQGQTFDYIGIYLREPVFSHGQLYVALSRVRTSKTLKILILPPTFDDCQQRISTRNVVFREVLTKSEEYKISLTQNQ